MYTFLRNNSLLLFYYSLFWRIPLWGPLFRCVLDPTKTHGYAHTRAPRSLEFPCGASLFSCLLFFLVSIRYRKWEHTLTHTTPACGLRKWGPVLLFPCLKDSLVGGSGWTKNFLAGSIVPLLKRPHMGCSRDPQVCVNTCNWGPPIVPLLFGLFSNSSHCFCIRNFHLGTFTQLGTLLSSFVIGPRFECEYKLTHHHHH